MFSCEESFQTCSRSMLLTFQVVENSEQIGYWRKKYALAMNKIPSTIMHFYACQDNWYGRLFFVTAKLSESIAQGYGSYSALFSSVFGQLVLIFPVPMYGVGAQVGWKMMALRIQYQCFMRCSSRPKGISKSLGLNLEVISLPFSRRQFNYITTCMQFFINIGRARHW